MLTLKITNNDDNFACSAINNNKHGTKTNVRKQTSRSRARRLRTCMRRRSYNARLRCHSSVRLRRASLRAAVYSDSDWVGFIVLIVERGVMGVVTASSVVVSVTTESAACCCRCSCRIRSRTRPILTNSTGACATAKVSRMSPAKMMWAKLSTATAKPMLSLSTGAGTLSLSRVNRGQVRSRDEIIQTQFTASKTQ